jgi:integrase
MRRHWAVGSSEVLYFFQQRRISMSVYLVKGKGWRYDFTLQGIRYTEAWFKTKTEAKQAEARKKEEIKNPKISETETIQTDMVFLDLVNLRLDHLQMYKSEIYYEEHIYKARTWVKRWGHLKCSDILESMIEKFIAERKKVSPQTANKEIRYLRALFNYGIKKKRITNNPVHEIEFIPEDEIIKYIPSSEDIDKVISAADSDTQDYLLTIRDTLGRMGEINRLTWDDINFKGKYVILYTRKKKGGNLKPRKVPMTNNLYEILWRRYQNRDKRKLWVFWHTYTSSKTGKKVDGPYKDRKKIMRTLCKNAGVKYFRFHPLRHSGASIMDSRNVPIGSIQKVLGHEHRSTTEIYLHSIGSAVRDAISVFEQAVKKSHTDSHTEQKKD